MQGHDLRLGLLCDEFVLSPLQTAFQTVNAEEEEGCMCIALSSHYVVILTSIFLEAANLTVCI